MSGTEHFKNMANCLFNLLSFVLNVVVVIEHSWYDTVCYYHEINVS